MQAPNFGPFTSRSSRRGHPAAAYVFERIGPYGDQPERRVFEATWFGNMAYYSGHQDLIQIDGRFQRPRRSSHNQLYVVNLTLGKVLRAVSKLLQTDARFAAAPEDDSLEARHASMVSEKLFEHARREMKFRSKLRRAMEWAAITGSGYLKQTWNPETGTPSRVYLEKGKPAIEPIFDPVLRQQKILNGEYVDTFPGDVQCDVVSPFQLYWDPNSTDEGFESSQWVAQVHIDSLPRLKERYGDAVSESSVYRAASNSELYEEQLKYIGAGPGGTELYGSPEAHHGEPRTRVIEYFEKPNKSNSMMGRYVLIVGDVVIRDEENHYAKVGDGIPFVKLDWFPFPGRWPGLSLVEQLRPPQRAHNKARTMALRWQQTMGYAPVYFPKNSGPTPRKRANEPGQTWEYNPQGMPPTFGPAPQMPAYIANNAEVAKQEMAEIAAQADPASGSMPGQLRSGRAVQLMQEDNNLILTPTMNSMLEAVEAVGQQVLQLQSLHYDKPRTIRTMGEDGEWEVNQFAGVDLRGQTKVAVLGQPAKFETAESFKDDILEYMQAGALNPQDPKDKRLILLSLNSKSSDFALNRLVRQERHEEKTIKRMIEQPFYNPQVMPFHDPGARSEVLEDFLNTDEFEGLDELTQQKLIGRWQQFSQMIAEQMAAQAEVEMATRGGPGQKGQASQPRKQQASA